MVDCSFTIPVFIGIAPNKLVNNHLIDNNKFQPIDCQRIKRQNTLRMLSSLVHVSDVRPRIGQPNSLQGFLDRSGLVRP